MTISAKRKTGWRMIGVLLLFVGWHTPVRAQQTPPGAVGDEADEPDLIVPARPTVSNPAEFQRPGVLQLEAGYNGNFRARDVRAEQDTPVALRFAVSRRFLLELDSDSLISQTTADGVRATGAGDTQLGVQAVLQHEHGAHPGIAGAYYIKLPTASATKNLGTSRVDHNFLALVSKKFGATVIDFNALYLIAGRAGQSGSASSGQAALAVSRTVSQRYSLQGELSGYSRNDTQPGAAFALGVLTYQVSRRLVFDGGVRAGLTTTAPRIGIVAGVTVGLADLYRRHRAGHAPELKI